MANFKVNNLSVSYQQKTLFENLTFEVGFPAFVAIVGSNGSGKTSFFKALLNQVPYRGEISVDEHPLVSTSLAFLPQHNSLNFDIKAIEIVVMGLFSTKNRFQNYSKADYVRAKEVMDSLGIAHLSTQNFQTLSGGEQQLVWLAQLILQDKKIWLLDEPLQQLDVKNKVKVTSLLQNYASQKEKLIFCVTHDLHLLSEQNKGWVLNFSEQQQELVPITSESIKKHLDFLSV